MSHLRIRLFGSVHVENETRGGGTQLTSTISTLLAYLILYRQRSHSRDVLANLLWSEYSQERARGCLNTALWRLRQALTPGGKSNADFLVSNAMGELAFSCRDDVWVDVVEFEQSIKASTVLPYEKVSPEDIEKLENAVGLYQGDLLDGCYCDWALRERERLRQHFVDALYYLLKYYQFHNRYEKAIEWGQLILMHDPLREDVHRQLMRLYLENGQRTLAVKQYRQCCQVLDAEMGIEPMPETQKLYELVMSRQPETFAITSPSRGELREAIERLQSAIETVNRAQRDLQIALERYS